MNELVEMVESAEVVHKPFLEWLHAYISERYLDNYLGDDDLAGPDASVTSSSSSGKILRFLFV